VAGNIFALRDGRIAYVDFGNVAELSQSNKQTLIDAVVHAVNEDYYEMASDFIKLVRRAAYQASGLRAPDQCPYSVHVLSGMPGDKSFPMRRAVKTTHASKACALFALVPFRRLFIWSDEQFFF